MKSLEKEVVRLEKVTPMRRESGWEKQGEYATYIKREDIVSILKAYNIDVDINFDFEDADSRPL